ncbi:hypothetical protein AVEN_62400-1 [Araneus ventricosus]|uniref:Uncharacterized protein n=1 Tax=Araneus ventricosus TaxID=182803 RepID=A0A4Y2IP93_ARAVE|nr:hypothetical protein AVEN_62400-1 [Araneus ventricosus]
MYVLVNYDRDARVKTRFSYNCRTHGVDGDDLDVTRLRSSNATKSEFVFMRNDHFAILTSRINALQSDHIVEVDGRRDIFASAYTKNVKKNRLNSRLTTLSLK